MNIRILIQIYKNNDFIDWKNEWQKDLLINLTKEKQSKLMKSNLPI